MKDRWTKKDKERKKINLANFQLIGRFGSNALLAALLFVSLLACVALMALVGTNLYRKRLLLFKKNEAADGAVSFHGNVISFSNPVLDPKPVSF